MHNICLDFARGRPLPRVEQLSIISAGTLNDFFKCHYWDDDANRTVWHTFVGVFVQLLAKLFPNLRTLTLVTDTRPVISADSARCEIEKAFHFWVPIYFKLQSGGFMLLLNPPEFYTDTPNPFRRWWQESNRRSLDKNDPSFWPCFHRGNAGGTASVGAVSRFADPANEFMRAVMD